jgi:hypothetical protein
VKLLNDGLLPSRMRALVVKNYHCFDDKTLRKFVELLQKAKRRAI